MLSLFDSQHLRFDGPVSGLCLWSGGLVAGTTSGAAYVVKKQGDHWEVPQRAVRLSKESIQHMVTACHEASVPERLVAITDEGVTMFTLPHLTLKGQAFRTKGAVAMAWHDTNNTLAVARPGSIGKPNQVEVFCFRNKEFLSLWKVNTPDPITQLSWLSNTLLCASAAALHSISPPSDSPARLSEVTRWQKRDHSVMVATSTTEATIFQGRTVHYFDLSAGQITSCWMWSPGTELSEVEAEHVLAELAKGAAPALQICYPYMLLSSVSAEFEVHLAMPEAAHTEVMTLRIPEAVDDTESVASTVGGSRPWRRQRKLLEPGLLFAAPGVAPGVAQEAGVCAGTATEGHGPSPHTLAVASRGSNIVQILGLRSLKEQLDVLVATGRIREALVVCEALGGEAQDEGIKDRLRVALGVHLCDEGDLDRGLSEIASASRIYPLAMLQYFPSLLPDRKAALATMDRSHMSAQTRQLLGVAPPTHASPRSAIPPHPSPGAPPCTAPAPGQPGRQHQGGPACDAPGREHQEPGEGAAAGWTPHESDQQVAGGRTDAPTTAAEAESASRADVGNDRGAGSAARAGEADEGSVQEDSGARVEDPAIEEASTTLVLPYLVTFRSRMLSQAAAPPDTAGGGERRAREVVDMALLLGWLQGAEHAALLSLLKQPNAVPLAQGREALSRAGLYLELVELFEGHGNHISALDIYRDLCVRPSELDPPPRGVSAGLTGRLAASHALAYLQRIPEYSGTVGLICLSLENWLLKADSDSSVELLLNRRPVVPPASALAALNAVDRTLAAPYLESAIATGIASAEDFHATLARIYMSTLKASAARQPDEGKAAQAAGGHARRTHAAGREADETVTQRLLEIIRESPHVSPAELLRQMPDAPSRSLLLARAALHERQQQHEAAMHVYVHQLHDPAAAEAFADRLYDAMLERAHGQAALSPATPRSSLEEQSFSGLVSVSGVDAPRDVYSWLLRALMNPVGDRRGSSAFQSGSAAGAAGAARGVHGQGGYQVPKGADVAQAAAERSGEAGEMLQYALLLIGRKWPRMDVAAALDCLPEDTKICDIGSCVSALSMGIMRQSNGSTLHASLLKAYKHQLCYESMVLDDKCAIVTPKSLCQVCHKRLGSQQALITPELKLIHSRCSIK